MGLLITAVVTGADIQDRDGGVMAMENIDQTRFNRLEEIVADGGYRGNQFATEAYVIGELEVRIVLRSDEAQGFELVPIRWIVERTFAWLGKFRRLAKDVEKTVESSTAMIHLAMTKIMLNRLTAAV